MNARKSVVVGKDVYVAPTAYLSGDLVIGDQCTIMHHVVIRADISSIRIGSRVNVQDGAVLHTPFDIPLEIGNNVGIAHRAVIHCRRIGSRTLLGIGSIALDLVEIGERCIVGAGAVIAPGTIIPNGKIVMGVPAKIVRDVTDDDLKVIDHVVTSYIEIGRQHAAGLFPAYEQGHRSAPGTGEQRG